MDTGGRGLKQRTVSARLEPSEPRGGGAGGTGWVTLSLCTQGRPWLLRGADGALLGSFLKEEPSWILGCSGLQGIPLTDLRGAGAGGSPGPWEPLLDPSPPSPGGLRAEGRD